MEVSLMEDDFNSEESLDLNDIFTDEFMSEYTDFESFGEFLAEAPARIEDQDDFDNMDMSEMDAFVAEVTKFEAWEDMQGEAVSLYTINQLGLQKFLLKNEERIIVGIDGTKRSNIEIGSDVKIVLKKDQRTNKLTAGKVKDILTNSQSHPHGIKVRLEDGQVGRVKE